MQPKPASEPIDSHPAGVVASHDYGTLRTSWFDCVTSLLAAVILFLWALVSLLAILWICSGDPMMLSVGPSLPEVVGGAAPSIAPEPDFLEPSLEEVVELEEPSMQETLLAVSDAVVQVAHWSHSSPDPAGHSWQRPGDGRTAGPQGSDIVPRYQRWQLHFAARDLQSYAQQLDHFGIELGVIGGAIQGVDYADHLSTRPQLRRGESRQEKRLYFMWTRPSPLIELDRQLLRAAGARLQGRELLKFVPTELENQLARIELEYAMSRGHGKAESIAKTVFTSQATGDGYRMVVSDQRYRSPAGGAVVLDRLSP